jgi:hypothetical protein
MSEKLKASGVSVCVSVEGKCCPQRRITKDSQKEAVSQ